MNRTRAIKAATALLAVSFGMHLYAQEGGADAAARDRPNILLVISDDIGIDVMSDMYPGLIDGLVERYGPSGLNHADYRAIDGNPASTPTLNRLARQGMLFTNVWAQPFCSPTRASILTGLFANKANVLTYADPLSQNHASFVQMLKDQAGYSTAMFGKWHLAGLPRNPVSYPGMKPKEAGFELFKGNLHAALPTYWEYDYRVQDEDTPANEWRSESPPMRSLPGIAPTTYAPVVKVADAIEWITDREAADPEKPWFAWLAFNLSHATSQRRPSQMAVPNADTLDAESYAEIEACGGVFESADPGSCSGEAQMRAMTNSLDTVLGKLLDALDELDPNTYVVFIGDNGTPMYGRPNLDFIDNMYISKTGRGKGTAYESGARVPMLIVGPGIEAGTVSDEYTHAADVFSTVLALAGLKAPARVPNSDGTGMVPVDGVSLAPILFGETSSVRDPNDGYVLTESLNLMRNNTRQVGARNASYKVICTDGAEPSNCELYDLGEDPLEEYPLDKPSSCSEYAGDGTARPTDPAWHFCRLRDVIAKESFLGRPRDAARRQRAPRGAGGPR